MPAARLDALLSAPAKIQPQRLAPSQTSDDDFRALLRQSDTKPSPTQVPDKAPAAKPARAGKAEDDEETETVEDEKDSAAPVLATALAPATAPVVLAPGTEATVLPAEDALAVAATTPQGASAAPVANSPAASADGDAASFLTLLAGQMEPATADAALGGTAPADAAAATADQAADATQSTATTKAAAAAAAASAQTPETGTDSAAALAQAGVSAIKGSLHKAADDTTPDADESAKTDAPAAAAPAKTSAEAQPDPKALADAAEPEEVAKAASAKDGEATLAADQLAAAGDKNNAASPLPGGSAHSLLHAQHSPAAAAPTTQPLAQTAVAVPLAAVPQEIASRAAKGSTKFDIRLDPAELGRIDVHIDIDTDGRVTSRLFVERSETLDLLKGDSRALEKALEQAGFRTDTNSLQFTLRDDRGGNNSAFARQDWQDRMPQGAQASAADDELARLTTENAYRSANRGSGGLDIRI